MSTAQAPAEITLPAELCLIGGAAAGVRDAAGALRLLAETAVAGGWAHPSYVEAVLAREETFPTGLPLPCPVAIPHADASHVARPTLAALVPPTPITFGEMGSKDRTVEAELVLMLLVDDPTQQVGVLAKLIGVLRHDDLRAELLDGATSADDLSGRFGRLLTGS